MLTNSMMALEDYVEAAPSESFSYKLRAAHALPGFGGWVEVTVHTDAGYDDSPDSPEKLTELNWLIQDLIRHSKAGPPWSIQKSGPRWNLKPCPGAKSRTRSSLSMTVVFPETDSRLQARLHEALQTLGVPARG